MHFLAGIFLTIGSFFGLVHPPAQQTAAVVETQHAVATTPIKNQGGATSIATTTIINNITQPVIERIIEHAPGVVLGASTNTVTYQELVDAIAAAKSQLSFSFSGSPESTPVSFAAFSNSQKIDQLSGTTLTNVTVHGVSGLTTSDIPDLSSLYYSATTSPTFAGTITANQIYQNTLPVATSRLAYRDLLFYDDFNRADTSNGNIGTSTSGSVYDLRGLNANVVSTKGRISSGHFVSDAGDVIYAIQALPENVTRIGARISWTTGNSGSDPGVFAMLISPSATAGALITNAIHVTVTRTVWRVQYISNGSFTELGFGNFSTTLAADGTSYPMEITLNGPVITYNLAGQVGSFVDPHFSTFAGKYATWEHYYQSSSVSDLLRIDAVWAGTSPISTGSLYAAGTAGTVGIGTSSPTYNLDILATTAGAQQASLIRARTTDFGGGKLSLENSNNSFARLGLINDNLRLESGNGGSTAGTLVMTYNTGNVGIASTSPWKKLSVTGSVGFDGLTGSTGAGSLCLSANKEVVYNSGSDSCLSSTRATKHDINNLNVDAVAKILALQSVSFVYNNDTSSTTRYGFIAEDTAAVDSHLATYDANGNISGIDDRSIISVIVKALQSLIQQVGGFADNFMSDHITATVADIDTANIKNANIENTKTKNLCVGSTCVTEEEFKALLQKENMPSTPTPTPSVPEPEATSTPTSEADSTSSPQATSTTETSPVDESTSTREI